MTLMSPGRSLISHDSPMGTPGGRRFPVKFLQLAAAPDAILEDGLESKRIKHGSNGTGFRRRHRFFQEMTEIAEFAVTLFTAGLGSHCLQLLQVP